MAARIREYDNELNLKPNDKGIGATANAAEAAATSGYRVGQMLKGVGNEIEGAFQVAGQVAGRAYTEYVVQPEISKGAALMSDLTLRLTQQWNEAASQANPNDTSIGPSFRERTQKEIEKFKSGFRTEEGQKWASERANSLLSHMDTKIVADGATRAGHAVAMNLESVENKLSATVMRDPTSFDFAIEQASLTVKDIVKNTPGLSGAAAVKAETELLQKMHKTIAQAALAGMANADPEAAEKALLAGKFSKYLNGVEEAKYVKSMISMKRTEVRLAKQDHREEVEKKGKEFANSMVAGVIQDDGSIRVTPKFMQDIKAKAGELSEASPSLFRELITFAERQSDRGKAIQIATDPEKYKELTNGIFSGKTTLEMLLRAQAEGKLADADFGRLHRNLALIEGEPLKNVAFKEALQAVEKTLVVNIPGGLGRDPKGAQSYSQFINNFYPDYLKLSKEGKLPDNALDLGDPNSMISKRMAPYKRTPAQAMADYVEGLGGITEALGGLPKNGQKVEQTNTSLEKGPPVPDALKSINNLSWSAKAKMFVDQEKGKAYSPDGSFLGDIKKAVK